MIFYRKLISFLRDKTGSILPQFALLVSPVLIAAGMSIDYSMSQNYRTKFQTAADAAVLAAAIEAKQLPDLNDEAEVKSTLRTAMTNFLEANNHGARKPDFEINDIKYNPDTQAVELIIDYSFDTSFMKIAGIDEIEGQVNTAVYIDQDELQSLSMYLVLDRSGSMSSRDCRYVKVGWSWRYVCEGERRIDSLKKAVNSLYLHFDKVDPDHKFVRTGAVAYNSSISGSTNLAWGAEHVNRFTSRLQASGGTSAHQSLKRAARDLTRRNLEDKEHAKKNSSVPYKYIVYMTDGVDHNDSSARKQCRNAKKKGIIIFSVAFQAPTQGQELLKYCATSVDHYFNATSSEELLAAFQKIGETAARDLAIAK